MTWTANIVSLRRSFGGGGIRRSGANPLEHDRSQLQVAAIAEAAVLADIAGLLLVLSLVIPGGFALTLASGVPFALLALRRGLRTVSIGVVSGALVVTLLSGPFTTVYVVESSLYGALVGNAVRRQWSLRRTLAYSVVFVWIPVAGFVMGFLSVFGETRDLVLEQITIAARGVQAFLGGILDALSALWTRITCGTACSPPSGVIGTTLVEAAEWVVEEWYLVLPVAILGGVIFRTWFTHYLARPVIAEVENAVGTAARSAQRGPDDPPGKADEDRIAPVPVSLEGVGVRWPGADRDAVSDVTLDVGPGELVGLVGDNGSGKSTLLSVLAGMTPTSGVVRRPGSVGMGTRGGTVRIFQRPESQVLGVTAGDDVVWGMDRSRSESVDAEGLLERVGLLGFAQRETSTLSGGELARLAMASALAHEPALLLSDESTAMLDRRGRAAIAGLMRDLADSGIAVVHVTHEPEEVESADRVIRLAGGRVAADVGVTARRSPLSRPSRVAVVDRTDPPLVRLSGVGHVHAAGTPWAHRALSEVEFSVHPRERLLVTGPNGAGKSTLAWILTGLLDPTEGSVHWSSRPPRRRNAVLAFQQARLQLFRPTVRQDMSVGVSVDREEVDDALRLAGFEPSEIGPASVYTLSVGQQRRVAIAGLLLHRPRLLVLDEPMAGLDGPSRKRLVDLLAALHTETDLATVVISHDLEDAPRISDRLLVIESGRVVEDTPLTDEVLSRLGMREGDD